MAKLSIRSRSMTDLPQESDVTHFGYRDVATADKASLVRGVFDSVAPRYDLMNDLMSLGVHRLWKAAMMDWLRPKSDMKLLDVGGGTGDIAFKFLERGGHDVTVCDINAEMLGVGRDRSIDRGLLSAVEWVNGDAEKLPFPDAHFDALTIAFCIRNVTHIDHALREARRVLKPGGRFLCLEFSKVTLPALAAVYDQYSFSVLPKLGSMVAGDPESYQYLAESIRKFPDQEAFAHLISDAGLAQVRHRDLSGGIAALHSAWRV